MRAAILVGGMGTRMADLFCDLPKPMIPVFGKPLLQMQIENLAAQNIYDITLIAGYRSDVIQSHFCNGNSIGVNITYIIENKPLGTGGALSMLPCEDTLVLFGDVYCKVDFKRFIRFHKEKNASITLFVHPNSHPFDSDIVICDEDNRVIAWKSKKDGKRGDLRNLANAGLYIFSSSALPQGKPTNCDLDIDLIRKAISLGKVYAYRSTEYVKDFGTPERLRIVKNDMENCITEARSLEQKQVAVFLDRDGTINKLRGLITSPDKIELISGVADAIRALNSSKYLVICVTNQPVVARGMATLIQLELIHARLDTLLGENGAYLDDLFFCPHHPDGGYIEEVPEYKIECDCRKPKMGLLIAASIKYNIDLSRSYMIGDSTADIATAREACCKAFGLRSGEALKDGKYDISPDAIYDSLEMAVKDILLY